MCPVISPILFSRPSFSPSLMGVSLSLVYRVLCVVHLRVPCPCPSLPFPRTLPCLPAHRSLRLAAHAHAQPLVSYLYSFPPVLHHGPIAHAVSTSSFPAIHPITLSPYRDPNSYSINHSPSILFLSTRLARHSNASHPNRLTDIHVGQETNQLATTCQPQACPTSHFSTIGPLNIKHQT